MSDSFPKIRKSLIQRDDASRLATTFLAVVLGAFALHAHANHKPGAAVVIEWNQLAQQYVGGPPFAQTRTYAMVHVAMADAVVAIESDYAPFRVVTQAPQGASAEAAAAQAAHDVLVVLAPGGTTAFDARCTPGSRRSRQG